MWSVFEIQLCEIRTGRVDVNSGAVWRLGLKIARILAWFVTKE